MAWVEFVQPNKESFISSNCQNGDGMCRNYDIGYLGESKYDQIIYSIQSLYGVKQEHNILNFG